MTTQGYPSARQHGHTFGEAFMLMKYRCEGCAVEEIIYNGRDGITPFIIGCRECGAEMRHTEWHNDVYDPTHVPGVGDRMFLDAAHDAMVEGNRRLVEQWWEHEEFPMSEHPVLGPLGKEDAAKYLADEEWERYEGHVPSVVVVDETMRQVLIAERLSGG